MNTQRLLPASTWTRWSAFSASITPDEALSLAEHHCEYFGFDHTEAVAFNKDQRIVIIGQSVTREIRQTAMFLGSKGIRVTCVEFTFFRDADGGRLLSQEIVVGREHAKPPRPEVSKVTRAEFLESCDERGRAVFSRILDLADRKSMSISWGIKGFSMGVEVGGTRVVICYVFPPRTLLSALYDRAGLRKKTAAPAEAVEQLQKAAEQTGLFEPAGRAKGMKCLVDHPFTEDEANALVCVVRVSGTGDPRARTEGGGRIVAAGLTELSVTGKQSLILA